MEQVFFCYPLGFFSRSFLDECAGEITRRFGSKVVMRDNCSPRQGEIYNAISDSWAICVLPAYAGMKTDNYTNYAILLSYQMEKGIYVMARDFSFFRINDIYEGVVQSLTETKNETHM